MQQELWAGRAAQNSVSWPVATPPPSTSSRLPQKVMIRRAAASRASSSAAVREPAAQDNICSVVQHQRAEPAINFHHTCATRQKH